MVRLRFPRLERRLQKLAYRMLIGGFWWQSQGTQAPVSWARQQIGKRALRDAESLDVLRRDEDENTLQFFHHTLHSHFALPLITRALQHHWYDPSALIPKLSNRRRVGLIQQIGDLGEGARPAAPALARVLRDESLDIEVREAGYRVLGYLEADDRPGVLAPNGVPDIDWVEIPAGQFLMGSDKNTDSQADSDETPQQTFRLDTFHISRYPVTYAQYEAFVNDGGYAVDGFWTPDGLSWRGDKRHPEAYWNDPQWHIANHPVVGVTWYEAYAFCQWFTERLSLLPEGEGAGMRAIRLPTEAEWGKAARGTDGRIYPYGDAFDPAKGNTSETGIGRTSAVDIFAAGASPYGVLDMSGNVWEWCLTKSGWRYADGIDAMNNDPAGTEARVVRGGAFASNPSRSRCAARYGSSPLRYYSFYGFRVCVSRPPS